MAWSSLGILLGIVLREPAKPNGPAPQAFSPGPRLNLFLGAAGMARNYLPERLEVIEDFPRTPSGKIQKFKLREQAIEELGLQEVAATRMA